MRKYVQLFYTVKIVRSFKNNKFEKVTLISTSYKMEENSRNHKAK